MFPRVDVDAIAERTPPDRDRYADLLRLSAIVLVVLGVAITVLVVVGSFRTLTLSAGEGGYTGDARIVGVSLRLNPLQGRGSCARVGSHPSGPAHGGGHPLRIGDQ
jgi:hypothetical protein